MSVWCSAGGTSLATRDDIFSICIMCMWMRRRSCFHTEERIVFRSISHKILPESRFICSLWSGTFLLGFSSQ